MGDTECQIMLDNVGSCDKDDDMGPWFCGHIGDGCLTAFHDPLLAKLP